jgi:hypothetical protein
MKQFWEESHSPLVCWSLYMPIHYANRPLCFALEVLHWCDQTMLSLKSDLDKGFGSVFSVEHQSKFLAKMLSLRTVPFVYSKRSLLPEPFPASPPNILVPPKRRLEKQQVSNRAPPHLPGSLEDGNRSCPGNLCLLIIQNSCHWASAQTQPGVLSGIQQRQSPVLPGSTSRLWLVPTSALTLDTQTHCDFYCTFLPICTVATAV